MLPHSNKLQSLRLILIIHLIVIAETNASAQTLSSVPVLQRKKADVDVQKISRLYSETTISKLFPAPSFKDDTEKKKSINEEIENWREASRIARDQTNSFARLMEAYGQYGELINISTGSEGVQKAVAYAVLASSGEEVIKKYFTEHEIETADDKDKIQKEINALKKIIGHLTDPSVTVFASGNIRGVATSKAPDPTTAGTGTLGATYADSRNIFSAQIAVASTQDTTRSGFGSIILAPANGKSLQSALIESYHRICGNSRSWAHFYATFGSSLWEIQKDSLYRNASVIGLGAMYHYRFFNGMIAETQVGLDGEIGICARWLDGDVRNLLNDSSGTLKYLVAFPTEKNFYAGLEAGITLNFGQVVGALQAYYLFPKMKESVDGLTGLQLAIGISVRGDIIRGFLSGND